MRKKQLLAFLMAGALSVGMTPAAAFAAEDAAVLEADNAQEEPAQTPEETPAENTQAPEENTETPQEDAETPAQTWEETPVGAETVTETPTPEATETPAVEETQIAIGDQAYASLTEAIAAVPENTDSAAEPVIIKVVGNIEISETVSVPANKKVTIAAAEEGTTIKRAAGFTGFMFSIDGGLLQMAGGTATQADGSIVNGDLTVDGTGEGVSGALIAVNSGAFTLADGATLTGNSTSGNGGAVSAAANTNIYLLGGTITGNTADAGAGVYSDGTVNVQGDIRVTGNQKADASGESNVFLGENGTVNVTGALSAATVGVDVINPADGRTVVTLFPEVTDTTLADALTQILYEGDTNAYKIDTDTGMLVSTAEPTEPATPTPTPTETPQEEKVHTIGKGMEWTGHNSVKVTFRSNVKGTYYIQYFTRGTQNPTIDRTSGGSVIDANTDVTRTIENLPEEEVDIYVCVVSDTDSTNFGSALFQPISASRPAAPVTETPTPEVTESPTPTPHNAKIPAVTESVLQGFENALVFYPGTYYDFRVIGAGTTNEDPGEGDVRWVPSYWAMSTNPSSSDRNTTWKIGSKKGIYTNTEKAYSLYVFFQKEVYNGSQWNPESGSIQYVEYQFRAAPLAATSITPTGMAGNGTGTGTAEGSADGTTGTTDDLTPTTYAAAADGTKSAVSTGDESPIGTMMALAAASVLAGGYVLVRRRKKEI